MTWKVYKVVFQMESPLHSGWLKVGNIQRTRLYVTGRMMWGALTANITRIIGGNYSRVGEAVKKYLITSYFFPAFDENGKKVVLPSYDGSLLKYTVRNIGDLSDNVETYEGNLLKYTDKYVPASIIERALITCYNATAIDPNGLSAEDGSLHEIELLNHKILYPLNLNNDNLRFGNTDAHEDMMIPVNSNVYLVGYIFESGELPSEIKDNWFKALKMVQLGGERNYGFGRLCLKRKDVVAPENLDVFGCELLSKDKEIKVEVSQGKQILANAFNVNGLLGVIEPFFGRSVNENGKFGEKYSSSVQVSWSPGSILNENKKFNITELGLWKGIS